MNNIGGKLKVIAGITLVVGIIGSIVGGITIGIGIGIIITIGGCISSFVISCFIYGFGELICLTEEIAENTRKQSALALSEAIEKSDLAVTDESRKTLAAIRDQAIRESVEESEEQIDEENIPLPDECPCCFSKISPDDTECPYCGNRLKK